MSERIFLDTNVLVHADDEDAGPKRDRARHVIKDALSAGAAVFSTQVLQEYFVNATRKLGLDAGRARARIDQYLSAEIVVVRVDHILGAIDLHRLRALSFWDALIIKSASESGCSVLMTEDLQDGETIEGVRITNPFRSPARGRS